MKFLHILRSEPDAITTQLIAQLPRGAAPVEVPLYQGRVDYARLVAQIFESERVICWW